MIYPGEQSESCEVTRGRTPKGFAIPRAAGALSTLASLGLLGSRSRSYKPADAPGGH